MCAGSVPKADARTLAWRRLTLTQKLVEWTVGSGRRRRRRRHRHQEVVGRLACAHATAASLITGRRFLVVMHARLSACVRSRSPCRSPRVARAQRVALHPRSFHVGGSGDRAGPRQSPCGQSWHDSETFRSHRRCLAPVMVAEDDLLMRTNDYLMLLLPSPNGSSSGEQDEGAAAAAAGDVSIAGEVEQSADAWSPSASVQAQVTGTSDSVGETSGAGAGGAVHACEVSSRCETGTSSSSSLLMRVTAPFAAAVSSTTAVSPSLPPSAIATPSVVASVATVHASDAVSDVSAHQVVYQVVTGDSAAASLECVSPSGEHAAAVVDVDVRDSMASVGRGGSERDSSASASQCGSVDEPQERSHGGVVSAPPTPSPASCTVADVDAVERASRDVSSAASGAGATPRSLSPRSVVRDSADEPATSTAASTTSNNQQLPTSHVESPSRASSTASASAADDDVDDEPARPRFSRRWRDSVAVPCRPAVPASSVPTPLSRPVAGHTLTLTPLQAPSECSGIDASVSVVDVTSELTPQCSPAESYCSALSTPRGIGSDETIGPTRRRQRRRSLIDTMAPVLASLPAHYCAMLRVPAPVLSSLQHA
jgi:hypothetical protein